MDVTAELARAARRHRRFERLWALTVAVTLAATTTWFALVLAAPATVDAPTRIAISVALLAATPLWAALRQVRLRRAWSLGRAALVRHGLLPERGRPPPPLRLDPLAVFNLLLASVLVGGLCAGWPVLRRLPSIEISWAISIVTVLVIDQVRNRGWEGGLYQHLWLPEVQQLRPGAARVIAEATALVEAGRADEALELLGAAMSPRSPRLQLLDLALVCAARHAPERAVAAITDLLGAGVYRPAMDLALTTPIAAAAAPPRRPPSQTRSRAG